VETSVADMAAVLAEILDEQAGIRPETEFGPSLNADVARSWADITKARMRLGWEPERQLREGLEETVQWFLKERTL